MPDPHLPPPPTHCPPASPLPFPLLPPPPPALRCHARSTFSCLFFTSSGRRREARRRPRPDHEDCCADPGRGSRLRDALHPAQADARGATVPARAAMVPHPARAGGCDLAVRQIRPGTPVSNFNCFYFLFLSAPSLSPPPTSPLLPPPTHPPMPCDMLDSASKLLIEYRLLLATGRCRRCSSCSCMYAERSPGSYGPLSVTELSPKWKCTATSTFFVIVWEGVLWAGTQSLNSWSGFAGTGDGHNTGRAPPSHIISNMAYVVLSSFATLGAPCGMLYLMPTLVFLCGMGGVLIGACDPM